MATKRQNILNYLELLFKGLPTFKHVEVKKVTPVDLETCPFPAVFIYGGKEIRLTDQRSVIGYETWLWPISIEIWSIDSDQEVILDIVHTAMFAERSFGGNAEYSERMGVEQFVVDPDQKLEAMLIDYETVYRHRKGDMSH